MWRNWNACALCGSVKWDSCCGEQYGDSKVGKGLE